MSYEWIENNSGICPVAQGTLVDIRNRLGEEFLAVAALKISHTFADASADYWNDDGCELDITHWRLHKPELTLEDAFDEPDSKPWTEAAMERLTYKYPETKPINVKKTIEQLAIDVLFNTTGKTYTEREIVAVVSVVDMLKKLENV